MTIGMKATAQYFPQCGTVYNSNFWVWLSSSAGDFRARVPLTRQYSLCSKSHMKFKVICTSVLLTDPFPSRKCSSSQALEWWRTLPLFVSLVKFLYINFINHNHEKWSTTAMQSYLATFKRYSLFLVALKKLHIQFM